ncbi:MAG: chromosome segregation protein SMC [Deltaproteobacteria bacterium]|nr:chromosome segregation protein SMC [Deltaproteobacteria bacterium]
MKIRELEICGFKSFKDSVKLLFDQPITCVVGPNGCGKSNIVDALRWCIGEQRPRMLRGENMEDVIFNGSEKQGPMGMAEVTSRFLVDEGDELPDSLAGCSELEVTRRLFRDKDTDYQLNRSTVRLRDITELFLGTGAGKNAYSIIGQGQITALVSSQPEERRNFVDEAAGITKFKARRHQAELKLKATWDNLDRINDIITEVKRSVISLSRQAKKAERYKKIKEDVRELELKLAAGTFKELSIQVENARSRVNLLASMEKDKTSDLEDAERRLENYTNEAEKHEQDLTMAQDELLRLQAEQERLLRIAGLGEQEMSALNQRNMERAGEIESLKQRRKETHREYERLKETVQALSQQAGQFEDMLEEKQKALREVTRKQSELAGTLDEARSRLLKIVSTLSESKSRKAGIESQSAALRARLAALESERRDMDSRIGDLKRNKKHAQERLDEVKNLQKALKQRIKAQEQLLEELAANRITAEAQVIALREELGDKRSRLVSLKELHKSFEGFGRGVRSIMREKKKLFGNSQGSSQEQDDVEAGKKIYGVVADLFDTPPRYEASVAAVLGERLQNVIVESHKEGVAAIEFLKKEAKGRCSFIPLGVRDPVDSPFPPMGGHGIVGRLIDLVSWQKPYEKIARYLLGDVVVVDSLKNALSLWNANGFRKTIVSLDGDVVDPLGAVTGGSEDSPGKSILRNKRLIRELEKEVSKLDQQYNLAKEQKEQLHQRTSILGRQLEEMQKTYHDRELDLVSKERDLSIITDDLSRTKARKDELDIGSIQVREELARLAQEFDGLVAMIHEAEANKQVQEKTIKENHGLAAGLKIKFDEVQEALTSLKVRSAAVMEKRESVVKNIDRLDREFTAIEEKQENLRHEVGIANQKSLELKNDIIRAREEEKKIGAAISDARNKINSLKSIRGESAALRNTLENTIKEARLQRDKINLELGEERVKAAELEERIRNLGERVNERYQLSLKDVEDKYGQADPPGADARDTLLVLRQKLEAMGEVNLTAIDEYKEVRERYDFLSGQRNDLEKTIASLKQAIQKMNREARERFRTTFAQLDEQFRKVFPRLFNGGRAKLILTGSEDVLEAGVEIVAQPPGKKLQSVTILSGGEKALTAIALLFALFQVKPPPFCILDEVDAPLDDANVDRYLALIKELSQKTQFILITHNKMSMELANRLYGVTMSEPGVSQIVSVELRPGGEPELREVG